jgi:hypothetical protein
MPMQPLAATITPELAHVDELMQRLGDWLVGRPAGAGAEPEMLAAHAAMQRLPQQWRVALVLLYVPHREPVQARMRRLRIKPRQLRSLHKAGLQGMLRLLRASNLQGWRCTADAALSPAKTAPTAPDR